MGCDTQCVMKGARGLLAGMEEDWQLQAQSMTQLQVVR